MSIKSEDGLVHDWDRSDTTEWAPTAGTTSDVLGVIAVVIVTAGTLIAVFGGTAPVVLPIFAVGVAVYVASIIRQA